MLKLFREKRTRIKNLKSELDKISSIKLDLSKYSQSTLKKIYFKENNNIEAENKLSEIYQNVFEIISGDLKKLNSLSLLELKQIMNQIDPVVNCIHIDKESLNKLKFLINVRKKIQQIFISKAVEVLNEARTLHNEAAKILIDGIFDLPIETIEKMKTELKACLDNVDFGSNIDIMFDISKVYADLNSLPTKKLKI